MESAAIRTIDPTFSAAARTLAQYYLTGTTGLPTGSGIQAHLDATGIRIVVKVCTALGYPAQ